MSNEDQADKCIQIALAAIEEQNWSKAEKFLDKSMKFHQSKQAQNLLYKLDTLRRRANESHAAPDPTPAEPEPEIKEPTYTEE